MLIGIIIGICVMSILATLGAYLIDDCEYDWGVILLGPMAWLIAIGTPMIIWIFRVLKPNKITKERLENLPHFYKMIGNQWCLCRWYAHKEDHPIRYHILIPMRVKIIDKPERIY